MPEWITDIKAIIAIVTAIVATIGGAGYWIGQVNSDRRSFKKFIAEVRSDIRAIQKDVKAILRGLPRRFVVGASPVTLTDLGERAAEILNARQWANEQAKPLLAKCKGLKEYEIYGLCQKYVMDTKSTWPDNMAECAFEFGTPVKPLTDVLTVVLRDELLERLGYAGSEVRQDS